MDFGGKLFRILNGLGMFMTGFLILCLFIWILITGALGMITMVLILIGAFVHAIMANALVRNLENPMAPLKETTPHKVQALAFFPIMIGLMVTTASYYMNSAEYKDFAIEFQNTHVKSTQPIPASTSDLSLLYSQIMMTSYGVILLGNAVLSLIYLKQWRDNQQEEKKDESPDDIGF